MNSSFSKVLGFQVFLILAMIAAALLPVGEHKPLAIGIIVLLLGMGFILLALLALVHGHVPWRFDVFYRRQDGFYFWLYVFLFLAGGLLSCIGGIGGIYRQL